MCGNVCSLFEIKWHKADQKNNAFLTLTDNTSGRNKANKPQGIMAVDGCGLVCKYILYIFNIILAVSVQNYDFSNTLFQLDCVVFLTLKKRHVCLFVLSRVKSYYPVIQLCLCSTEVSFLLKSSSGYLLLSFPGINNTTVNGALYSPTVLGRPKMKEMTLPYTHPILPILLALYMRCFSTVLLCFSVFLQIEIGQCFIVFLSVPYLVSFCILLSQGAFMCAMSVYLRVLLITTP